MAELYQTTPQNITLHLKAIYQEGELDTSATCKEFLQVQSEGSRKVSRTRKFYNLTAIIAVGYRVRSTRGTQFRCWATERLNEYLGYAEDQAKRHRQIFTRDWHEKLDAFLQFNERDILKHPGKVNKAVEDKLALGQYEIFHQHRLAEDARDEKLADDDELKLFLEGGENRERK